jgi:light-regulated signal transduction histidine kinase (bacteriophytochrome)
MQDLSAALRNQPPARHEYDWDPIHMPGAVQSYGALIVADPVSRRIEVASENLASLFGIDAAGALDRSWSLLFDRESERAEAEAAIRPDTILFPNPMRVTIGGHPANAVFHAHAGKLFIEIEPHDDGPDDYDALFNKATEELFDPGSVEALCQRAVEVVRRTTGFDRVMLYRFDPRCNGQVIAESRRDGVDTFLGMFFPSADIPARMRELYLTNFTRYIPDMGAPSHRLLAVAGAGGRSPQVDMTYANLRSVMPCHIGYLQAMGVQASMSFSINVDNKLWGLFACHHYAPRPVSYDRRVVCEQSAMMFIYKLVTMTSSAARLKLRRDGLARLRAGLTVGGSLARRIAAVRADYGADAAGDAAAAMVQRALAAVQEEICWLVPPDAADKAGPGSGAVTAAQKLLLDLVEADSAAVVRSGQVYRIGDAPGELTIYAISALLGRELPDIRAAEPHAFATDSLAAIVPAAEEIKDRAAGVLVVPLAFDRPDYLLWFRRELIVQATWAGNPSDLRADPTPDGRNPRASFAAWKRDIRNLSRAWEIEDVQVADELAAAVRSMEGARGKPPAGAPPRVATGLPNGSSAQGFPMRAEVAGMAGHTRRIVRISTS